MPALVKLLARTEGQPVALIGVNSDKGEDVAEKIRERGIAWRNALDGGTSGPVSSRYNVKFWPTLYLLDRDGVIRFRGHEVSELERVLDALLADAKRGRSGSK